MAKELTTLTIAKIKPGAKRLEVPDGRVPSLYLIVQPTPSDKKSWAYRYVLTGRKRKFTIGPYPLIGLKDAREAAWKAKDSVAHGIDPATAKRATITPPDDLVDDAVEEFLKRHGPHLKAATRRDVRRILYKDAVPAWRGRSLKSISKKDVIRLLDAITDRGAPVGANRLFAWTRKFFRWSLSRGLIDIDPTIGVEAPAPEISRDRVLSDPELAAIWHACDDDLNLHHTAFIQLLILTGCRRGEVAGMRRQEVNLDLGTWVIPAARTKGGRDHVVQLSSEAKFILCEFGGQREYLLGSFGRRPFTNFAGVKRAIVERLPRDFRPWRLHDLRRTFATGLAKLEVAVHVTEAALGHRGGTIKGVAAIYNRHDYARETAAAMELWAQHVAKIAYGDEPSVIPFHRG